MQKYISEPGLKARNNPWPYKTSPYAEQEIEPFTKIEIMEEPKRYYTHPRKMVRFRVEGGKQDYFAELKHFIKYTYTE